MQGELRLGREQIFLTYLFSPIELNFEPGSYEEELEVVILERPQEINLTNGRILVISVDKTGKCTDMKQFDKLPPPLPINGPVADKDVVREFRDWWDSVEAEAMKTGNENGVKAMKTEQ